MNNKERWALCFILAFLDTAFFLAQYILNP